MLVFFFSSRRRHTRCYRDWSSDVCSSDLIDDLSPLAQRVGPGVDERFVLQVLELVPGNRVDYQRSEERRVGKECRSRGSADQYKKKKQGRGVPADGNGRIISRGSQSLADR